MTRLQKIKRVKIVVLSSIGSAVLMFLFGSMITNAIATRNLDRQNLYLTAHRVDCPDSFRHLLDTSGGRTIAYGHLYTDSGVGHEYLDGEWFAIRWSRERYVTETRTRTDDDGNTITYTVDVWRSYGGGGSRRTNEWTFLNQTFHGGMRVINQPIQGSVTFESFPTSQIMIDVDFRNWHSLNPRNYAINPPRVSRTHIYNTRHVSAGRTIRTSFDVIPMSFAGSFFMDIGPDQITCPHGNHTLRFHHDRNTDQVVEHGMRDITTFVIVLWVILSIGIVGAVIYFKHKIWLKGICFADVCPSNLLKYLKRRNE